MQISSQEAINVDESVENETVIVEEQARRAGVYSILAALLRETPDQALLDHLAAIDVQADNSSNELLLSLSMLSLSSRQFDPKSLASEYHDLFIGVGRGELLPYGSWYQTGFLMEKPLSQLREDLAEMGFERDETRREPEDHIAALCEVMELLILEKASLEKQTAFYETHIGSWAERFFSDLAHAETASYYRSVARFGLAFLALESKYLKLLA